MQGHACLKCGKCTSVWSLPTKAEETLTICSMCVLYDQATWCDSAKEMITQIEVSRGRMFERDQAARLVKPKDADDVVGALVLLARVSSLGAGAYR